MKVPKNYLIYECGGKYFGSYNMAWKYHTKCKKMIHYVLTLNMCHYRFVSDIERGYKEFCKKHYDCDSYDLNSKTSIKQMILEGVNI